VLARIRAPVSDSRSAFSDFAARPAQFACVRPSCAPISPFPLVASSHPTSSRICIFGEIKHCLVVQQTTQPNAELRLCPAVSANECGKKHLWWPHALDANRGNGHRRIVHVQPHALDAKETVELCMFGGRCTVNAAYAESYLAAAESRTPFHMHHKNRNSHGIAAGHSLRRQPCVHLILPYSPSSPPQITAYQLSCSAHTCLNVCSQLRAAANAHRAC
jgi:hypothetical protein